MKDIHMRYKTQHEYRAKGNIGKKGSRKIACLELLTFTVSEKVA